MIFPGWPKRKESYKRIARKRAGFPSESWKTEVSPPINGLPLHPWHGMQIPDRENLSSLVLMAEILLTSWGSQFIPLLIGFYRCCINSISITITIIRIIIHPPSSIISIIMAIIHLPSPGKCRPEERSSCQPPKVWYCQVPPQGSCWQPSASHHIGWEISQKWKMLEQCYQ